MPKFEWRPLFYVDPQELIEAKNQFHQAIQNVASVGRLYLPEEANDENATLSWVPGLNRMAGKWVNGSQVFRSSLSLTDFAIYVVDRKVQPIARLELEGQTFRQSLIWLEEQIGRLGLDTTHLSDAAPYEIPAYAFSTEPFKKISAEAASFWVNLYHNTYAILKELANKNKWKADVVIWPHHFDEALREIVRETGADETNTTIGYGMSPGDQFLGGSYFYVSSWPHVDVRSMESLSIGKWVEDDWTGAILPVRDLLEMRNQRTQLFAFFERASEQIRRQLLS